jgi:hypothetical protein
LGKVRINVGNKEYGYDRVDVVKSSLQHYLDNVAPRYNDDFVEKNRQLAKDFLNGKNLAKYAGLVGGVVLASIALLGLAEPSLAFAQGDSVVANGIINTDPLDRFFKEVYWAMFRILMYISTPVWAWVGIILATGGANEGKRTQAKKIGLGLIVGSGITASAPWVTKQLVNLWKIIFS